MCSSDLVEAVTHFEVVEQFGPVTKLRLRLETGRTHQIRVQAAESGLPLLGDRMYHPDRGGKLIDRQALHAESLQLEHPDMHKRMTWRAPLPADLRELEFQLRKGVDVEPPRRRAVHRARQFTKR